MRSELQDVKSSIIQKACYEYEEQKLRILYNSGVWYEWAGIPKEVWAEFICAESQGQYTRGILERAFGLGRKVTS